MVRRVRRTRAMSPEEKRVKKREFWSWMLTCSILLVCTGWGSYFWERTTGVTVSTRRQAGRLSTSESLSSTFNTAFAMTIVALPVFWLSLTKRREYL